VNSEVQPALKGRQHVDEKYIKINKNDAYDLNCKDSKTKFITAHLLVDKRTKINCIRLFKQIKDACYFQILKRYKKEKHKPVKKRKLFIFVFDKFANYKSAWNKLFGRVTKAIAGVPIACKKFKLEYNNNPIENYNGGLKSRLKVMRGGFRSWEGAEAFLDLRRIIYNFVNPQQGLHGKTPSESAGIKIKLGRNRLLGLIRWVSKISR